MPAIWIGGIVGLITAVIVLAWRVRHGGAAQIDVGQVSENWIMEHRADSKRE